MVWLGCYVAVHATWLHKGKEGRGWKGRVGWLVDSTVLSTKETRRPAVLVSNPRSWYYEISSPTRRWRVYNTKLHGYVCKIMKVMFRWCSAGKSSAIRPLQSRPLASYHPRPPPQPTAPIYCCPSIPSAKENITFHIADTGGIFRPTGTPISSYRCHLPSFHSQNKLYVDQGAKKHSKLKLEGRQREREREKKIPLSLNRGIRARP